MKRSNLIEGYAEWLSTFRWNWFATLTFRQPNISQSKANRIFRIWILEIKEQAGRSDFRWFLVAEHGAYGDHLHFHVLVGGLRNGSKWPWIIRWDELAGEAFITYYFRLGGATRYIAKTVRPGVDFDVDFDLSQNPPSQ